MNQSEATLLIGIGKKVDGGVVEIRPGSSSYHLIPLDAQYKDHRFLLDIRQSSIAINKITSQQRVHTSIVLSRLDIDGARHTNPQYDPATIPGGLDMGLHNLLQRYDCHRYERGVAHLHIYIEGFDERWAFPPEEFGIIHRGGQAEIVRSFCERFNISPPRIRSSLI